MSAKRLVFLVWPALLVLALAFRSPVLLSPSHPVEIDDADEIAEYYGITFPIPELGNCASFAECLAFCEDPVNYDTCIEYAKEKGFYQEDKVRLEEEDFWQETERVLGCNSYASCHALCESPENYERCNEFARTRDIHGGYEDEPDKEKILSRARQVLGCDSYQSCRDFCESPENYERCNEFAKTVGLRGGEYHAGPGGCSSEESCRQFCSDPANFNVCSNYAQSGGQEFAGPGGCTSEQSCKEYCQKRPQECRYFGSETADPEAFCKKFPEKCQQFEATATGKDFEEYCLKFPDECSKWKEKESYYSQQCNRTTGCSWANNTCQCKSKYETYCRDNPDKCQIGPGGYSIPEDKSGFDTGEEYDYCKKYPDKCRDYPSHDPASECTNQGCYWTGTTCECPTTGEQQAPSSYDPAEECTNQGCSWTGTTCECPRQESTTEPGTTDEATLCAESGCSWTGTTCECPEVYGTRTVAGWLQRILQFFFGR